MTREQAMARLDGVRHLVGRLHNGTQVFGMGLECERPYVLIDQDIRDYAYAYNLKLETEPIECGGEPCVCRSIQIRGIELMQIDEE